MSNFDVAVTVPVLTVFFQGLLSFFSPCVLPLLPIYLGYLSGGLGEESGRKKMLLNTIFFVTGISAAFFLLGLGMTAIGRFFNAYQSVFVRVGGVLVILFGLYQLGVIRFGSLDRERRIHLDMSRLTMNPLVALLMGFTFSFAWTPCVGPALAGVLLMASSAGTMAKGLLLIEVYTWGFIMPFLAVAFFADSLLGLFRRHQSVVKYTAKLGGVLLVAVGIMMVNGWMSGITGDLAQSDGSGLAGQESDGGGNEAGRGDASSANVAPNDEEEKGQVSDDTPETGNDTPETGNDTPDASGSGSDAEEQKAYPAPEFTLVDQFGNSHTMSAYKGKTVLLNFWATWCGPCRMEMPDLQSLYEDWGENSGDLVVLGVALPNAGQEGSAEEIAAFLEENSYTYPTVMDDGTLMSWYGISSFPTTWMVDTEGNLFGYVTGSYSREVFDRIVQQTMEGRRD